VDEPQNVGADRALNAIAAHSKYQGDLVVIDFGTATTFDVVDYTGAYKGGIIAPGINLSLDALVNAAAKLPRIAIEVPADASVIGRTTESQMLTGHLLGLCRDDGGAGRALEARDRPAGQSHCDGGPRSLFDKHTDCSTR
jgi:type III pantothenate kinase